MTYAREPSSGGWRSPRRIVVVTFVTIAALVVSLPNAWHLSMQRRVDRLDAIVARRQAAFLAFDGEMRDGDRDCDTSQELARRYRDAPRIAPSDELVGHVHDALACRRSWNAELRAPGWIDVEVVGLEVVDAYLRAVESEDPDACLRGATEALRLADRLGTGAGLHDGGSSLLRPVERILACADRASPGARAASLAAVAPLALEPEPMWFAIEHAAIETASVYAEDARHHSSLAARAAILTRPSLALEAPRLERRAYEALAFTNASRSCDDACLVRMARRAATYVTRYASHGASRPLLDATHAVSSWRVMLRAAVVALDDACSGDPRLASPWGGGPMRVTHLPAGVRVEWDGPDGSSEALPLEPRHP